MRIFTSFFLIGIIALSTVQSVLLVLNFKANQEFFAQTKCIQKNEVINLCKGSCVLEEQLQIIYNYDQKSENQSLSVENLLGLFQYIFEDHQFSLNFEDSFALRSKFRQVEWMSFDYYAELLKPPSFIS